MVDWRPPHLNVCAQRGNAQLVGPSFHHRWLGPPQAYTRLRCRQATGMGGRGRRKGQLSCHSRGMARLSESSAAWLQHAPSQPHTQSTLLWLAHGPLPGMAQHLMSDICGYDGYALLARHLQLDICCGATLMHRCHAPTSRSTHHLPRAHLVLHARRRGAPPPALHVRSQVSDPLQARAALGPSQARLQSVPQSIQLGVKHGRGLWAQRASFRRLPFLRCAARAWVMAARAMVTTRTSCSQHPALLAAIAVTLAFPGISPTALLAAIAVILAFPGIAPNVLLMLLRARPTATSTADAALLNAFRRAQRLGARKLPPLLHDGVAPQVPPIEQHADQGTEPMHRKRLKSDKGKGLVVWVLRLL